MKKCCGLLMLFCLLLCKTYAQQDTPIHESDALKLVRQNCSKAIDNQNWDSALYYGKRVDTLLLKEYGGISDNYAATLYLVGEVYRVQGDTRNAYTYFKKSAETFDSLDKVISLATYALALGRVGYMCFAMGALEEAEHYFLRALDMNKMLVRSKNIDDDAQIYLMLASIYGYKGVYDKADSINWSVMAILDTLPVNSTNLYLQASIYGNEATIYTETGNYEKALEFLKKSLRLEVAAKDSGWVGSDYVLLCLNLAELYALMGNLDGAWSSCALAEDSIQVTDPQRSYLQAKVLKEKAFLFQQQNKYEEAIDLNKKFISIADTSVEIFDDYYASLCNLGTLYSATEAYAGADSLFRKVIHKLQDSGLIYSYPLLQAKKWLCINLIKEKKFKESTDSLLNLIQLDFEVMSKNFEGMSEGNKLKYQREADKIFDLLYICLSNQSSITSQTIQEIYRDELKRKGLVLRNQLNQRERIRNMDDSVVNKLYSQWLNNKQIISMQYSLPYNQRLFKIDSLEDVNEILEKKVAARSSYIVSPNENFLPASLIPDSLSATIEFVRYDYRSLSTFADSAFYAAFISTATDTIPRFINLCGEQKLIYLMKNKTGEWINENQLAQNIYNTKTSDGRMLYHLIWQKLDKHLTDIKYINYSATNFLNNISFPAIHDGKQFLINRYIFKHYFSLQQAYTAKDVFTVPGQISVWGNINYNSAVYDSADVLKNKAGSQVGSSPVAQDITSGSLTKDISAKPLEALNTDEVENLKKIFHGGSTKVYSYENNVATEDNFKWQSPAIKGILHISTHGFYTPFNESHVTAALPADYISGSVNPLFRCGLAFAGVNYYWLNGKPRDNHDDGILTGYEVAGLDLHNVQLVTLSACETGLGDVTYNEGDIGLQRAFKIAGVQNLLVSLWQVPAKQTSELLTLFYKNLYHGTSLNEALRGAELIMEKKYPPYYWAGFVLIE